MSIRKIILPLLGLILFSTSAKPLACNWDTATKIYSDWRPFSKIKFCRLSHLPSIPYTVREMLNSANRPHGQVIPYGASAPSTIPIVPVEKRIELSSISLNTPIPLEGYDIKSHVLKFNPEPYYLLKSSNTFQKPKEPPEGIFRFLTEVHTYSCQIDPLGFKHIFKEWKPNFFDKLTVNGKKVEVVATNWTTWNYNKTESIARVESAVMANESNDGQLKVKVDFYVGKKGETPSFNGWPRYRICSLDVYAKLTILPNENNSVNFKSGNYKLNLTIR